MHVRNAYTACGPLAYVNLEQQAALKRIQYGYLATVVMMAALMVAIWFDWWTLGAAGAVSFCIFSSALGWLITVRASRGVLGIDEPCTGLP